jgi:hypothetical protein
MQQYDDLANAYIVASLRRGRFLTVTAHRELDRSVVSRTNHANLGHGDPLFFDVDYFYEVICRKLLLPVGTTFGIQSNRLTGNAASNRIGQVNEFVNYVRGTSAAANQYGPPRWQSGRAAGRRAGRRSAEQLDGRLPRAAPRCGGAQRHELRQRHVGGWTSDMSEGAFANRAVPAELRADRPPRGGRARVPFSRGLDRPPIKGG